METAEPSESTVGTTLGWFHRLRQRTTGSADRRMIIVWVGWTIFCWTVAYAVAVYAFGGSLLFGAVISLVQHSTVYSLGAAAAFIRPHTLRSVLGPAALYWAWTGLTFVLAATYSIVNGTSVWFAIVERAGGFAYSFGHWIWLGVNFYLMSQLLGIYLTRESEGAADGLTVKKLMGATLLAAAAFALQQITSGPQIWAAPDLARLVMILTTSFGAIVWCVVLWMQICSSKIRLLLIVLTTALGLGLTEFLYAIVWSQMEVDQPNTTIGHPSLWQTAASWLMSMFGVWIALQIAKVGGYRVRWDPTWRPHGFH